MFSTGVKLSGRYWIFLVWFGASLFLTCSKEKECYTCKMISMRYALHPAPRTDGMAGPDQLKEYISFHCDMTYAEIKQYERTNTHKEYSVYQGDTTVYSSGTTCWVKE